MNGNGPTRAMPEAVQGPCSAAVGGSMSTRARRAGRRLGFTLIEMLVVLVIVAVMVAVATLAVGGSGARELQNAAERSFRLIELACERAELGGRDIGFQPLRDGLRFGYYEIDGWRALGDDGADELRARAWGDGIEVEAERDGESLPLQDEADGDPSFACLASGELTPLALTFSRPGVDERWRLQGELDGSLALNRLDDDAR